MHQLCACFLQYARIQQAVRGEKKSQLAEPEYKNLGLNKMRKLKGNPNKQAEPRKGAMHHVPSRVLMSPSWAANNWFGACRCCKDRSVPGRGTCRAWLHQQPPTACEPRWVQHGVWLRTPPFMPPFCPCHEVLVSASPAIPAPKRFQWPWQSTRSAQSCVTNREPARIF